MRTSTLSTERSSPRRTHRKVGALLAALGLWVLPLTGAWAAPPCLDNDNQCEPDKLCTFKASLAEKVLIYRIYLRNSQVTKSRKTKTREGVPYDGTLYDESVAEAQHDFPHVSAAEQMVKAGQIFQEKVRAAAKAEFKPPACSYGGTLNTSLLPKDGYAGMFTDANCKVHANFEAGDYDADGFGANDKTSCPEFYDRDRAHEAIHKQRCEAAMRRGKPETLAIDQLIESELIAYAHSVRLTQAYVRLLSLQCSSKSTPQKLQQRARDIQRVLTQYQQKGK